MLSPKQKRTFLRILPFGIIWLLFGIIFLVVESAATKDYPYHPKGVIQVDWQVFTFAMIAVTFVGLLIGTIELLLLNKLFRKSSFLKKIIGKLFIYSILLFIIIVIMFPIAASIELNASILDRAVWNKFAIYLQSISFLSTGFQMFISLGFSLFYAEISENIGPNILLNFISGKYHKPKQEERIFMFLDMRSSTTIAEKLGDATYFELLKEYYQILSTAVINTMGEIYQYVGDEMVISWKYTNGIKDANCVRCFFMMKEDLLAKKQRLEQKYGVFPEFKAGIHLGTVTTGEIGSLKKEIIFTGDVLNACARIQALCNELKVDLLVSEELLEKLTLTEDFTTKFMGDQQLKGKLQRMKLYTINTAFDLS